MVLFHKSTHEYDFSFSTASLAFFNKYPNPFSKHVVSADTIGHSIDEQGRLHVTRLIRKRGRLPQFVKPLLSGISESWIIETCVVDAKTQKLQAWTTNMDHRKVLRVDEFSYYEGTASGSTVVNNKVKFTSNFGFVRDRIESWSLTKFAENVVNSRQGMRFVMEQLTRGQLTI